MDLYGDLPPTSEGSDLIASGGWANVDVPRPTHPIATKVAPKQIPKQDIAAVNKVNQPIVVNKVVAKQQLFKPRQTSTVTSNTATNIIPAKKLVKKTDISVFEPKETVVSSFADSFVDESSLNFECDDEYDPRRPNDYIKWCEERQESKRLLKVAEENAAIIEEQERLRQQRELERLEAAKQGNLSKLQELMPMGRGRGRGVVNLPSWMTDNPSITDASHFDNSN